MGMRGGSIAGQESLSLSHLGPHRCVQQLLQHGASVKSRTEEEDDTALHIAARHGLTDHVQLLLRHGAELEARNEEGQTPLNAACAQPHQPRDMDRYYQVCQLLVESGASINAADRDRQHPLHLACKNANAQIAELLLARGANVNVMNYSGNTALHNILQAAAYKLDHHPELVVQALLNYGAIRIWPGALLKVRGSQPCGSMVGKGECAPVRTRVFVSQKGLFCASLLACLFPRAVGGEIDNNGKGFPKVFSWGMFSCRTLPLPSAKLCGQYLLVSLITCPGKCSVFSSGGCFFFGPYPPAHAASGKHQ